jgi:hypothetical protein
MILISVWSYATSPASCPCSFSRRCCFIYQVPPPHLHDRLRCRPSMALLLWHNPHCDNSTLLLHQQVLFPAVVADAMLLVGPSFHVSSSLPLIDPRLRMRMLGPVTAGVQLRFSYCWSTVEDLVLLF